MKNLTVTKRIASVIAAAAMSFTAVTGTIGSSVMNFSGANFAAVAAESSVKFYESAGFAEGVYAKWAPVTNATGYNVYVDGTQLDAMLIRQYSGYFRADALGLKSGQHTIKVVPVISGSEDSSKAASTTAAAYAHDRSGYAFEGGAMPGAYNADGTLKSNATVIYVTEENKNTVSVTLPDKKGNDTALTGVQNIITNLKSNTKCGPVAIRFIGNVTDPANMPNGDIYVDAVTCGLTVEGVGSDATFNGFGLVIKNSSLVEARNLGFMNCDSSEGDDVGLQQADDHCWVHNCDMFYGDAGSDADQVKGDGALDTKKSTYITHSYNHFWDNGKCNLQGANTSDTSNYITYHHNWYDHSDSRHPRVRVATVHVYNNYYDGNAKYGIGSTSDSDIFAENNYFRNCKYPMLISMQGNDVTAGGIFSSEDGGIIKAYGNYITGGTFTSYQDNSTEFDAYVASSRNETVPSSVKAKQGGATYNNFDTSSSMYSYTPDAAADVPSVVTAKAGRVNGGDFQWTFDNSVDDAAYDVNTGLKAALVAYDDSILAIGSGFKSDSGTYVPTTTTTAASTPIVTTTIQTPAVTTTTASTPAIVTDNVIYASPNGTGDGSTMDKPTDVLTAISNVKAGGTIYLLAGTYKYSSPIIIEEANAGAANAYKTISAYPGASVTFDFSGMEVSGSNRGFVLDGSYWHFYGFTIEKAGDNGMLLSGDNNIIERMIFNDNQDTGLQLSRYQTSYSTIAQWPTNNLIKNCTSKNNCDDATMENADGFAAKLTCGEGNVFDGCISYNNSDDGWDLYAKTETGPIGVVTIQNCIAARNGFTESGEGFGDCDGNGFKLGGSGVGSAHKVINCLAFENLHCGFTDNNNPELGKLENCTAINNGIDGSGKPNISCYRCTACDFDDIISYYGTPTSINGYTGKATNDKFVGTIANSIYYNSGYYQVDADTAIANGDKIGTKTTSIPCTFKDTRALSGLGQIDFDKEWRNADGSINTQGYYETTGSYESMGYHLSDGSTVVVPPTTTTNGGQPVVTTTTTPSTPVSEGDQVHNFTANGLSSSFYTITGNLSTAKGTVSYNGLTLTQCLKIETATSITFNASSAGKLTLVFIEPAATIKVNDTKYTSSSGDGIITVDVSAGTNTITKADSANLFYMVFSGSGTAAATTTTQTPVTTTTTTVPAPDTTTTTSAPITDASGISGDSNNDGTVSVADATLIMQSIANPNTFKVTSTAQADCAGGGDGVTSADALAIQQFLADPTLTLPRS